MVWRRHGLSPYMVIILNILSAAVGRFSGQFDDTVFAVPLRAGGQFWVNGTGTLHLPRTAFSMNGAGGQYVIIDAENDLVIVTFHHRLGGVTGGAVRSLNAAFDLLPTALPGFTIPAEAKL